MDKYAPAYAKYEKMSTQGSADTGSKADEKNQGTADTAGTDLFGIFSDSSSTPSSSKLDEKNEGTADTAAKEPTVKDLEGEIRAAKREEAHIRDVQRHLAEDEERIEERRRDDEKRREDNQRREEERH